MSGYHNYHRGYGSGDHEETTEDFLQGTDQYPSQFVPYPEQFWPSTSTGGYNISIDTTAVHAHELDPTLDPNYAPLQSYDHSATSQQWPHLPPARTRSSESSIVPASNYMPPDYSGDSSFPYSPYPVSGYPHGQNISPSTSTDVLLSPSYPHSAHISPHTTPPLHLTPPTTPGGSGSHHSFTASPSPTLHSPLLVFDGPIPKIEERTQPLYTHRDQLQFFKDALSLPAAGVCGPFVPQLMYKPHTNSDRRRYVEEVDMEAPIHFWVENPSECGIPLSDALHSRVRRLLKRDETVFEGRGPSVSIRLEWPGYRQWSRQIPTKDFRSPPGPITRAKLAKNVAKCVQRFIQERHGQPMEDDADARWRVGPGPNQIKLEDLVLVSIHHVSMGSWQPHLRLRRPL
ncbi:hypothetical protein C8J57DRAFT_85901 [Mycena rebaudengoi]|nr:hypothetical protein C8J57DRAFT_85901 [Mycena rebaudengoi]